jgi:hypothetical protein
VRRPLLALLLLAVLCAPTARADGDPASDYLISQNIFVGVELPHGAALGALNGAVAAAYAHGYRIRVAVVATRTDLGSIPSLFGRPSDYAKFLGTEIGGFYIGPLLIVMPAGFGVYDGGRSVAAETAVLAGRPSPGTSRDELTRAAAAAVDSMRIAGALRSKDVLAPAAAAVPSSGRAGRSMRLHYTVFDDSGRSAVTLEVRAGTTTLATIKVPLAHVVALKTYAVPWRVPMTIPTAKARLCVTAFDPSGNRSRPYCAPLDLAPA